jgi:hypothetical protein
MRDNKDHLIYLKNLRESSLIKGQEISIILKILGFNQEFILNLVKILINLMNNLTIAKINSIMIFRI